MTESEYMREIVYMMNDSHLKPIKDDIEYLGKRIHNEISIERVIESKSAQCLNNIIKFCLSKSTQCELDNETKNIIFKEKLNQILDKFL